MVEPPMQSAASPPTSLRRKFTRAVVLAALLPAACLGIAEQIGHYRTQQAHLRDQVEVATVLGAAAVDEFMAAHLSGVALLARLSPPDADWPDRLNELQARYPAFISTLVTDAEGNVRASAPNPAPDGRVSNVSDREYFRIPRDTGHPVVSNAFRGRRIGVDPLVAVAAPLQADGRFAGVVEGSIHVDAFTSLRTASIRRRGMEILILDREHRVIHASQGLPYRFLQPLDASRFDRPRAPGERTTTSWHLRGVLADGGGAWGSRVTLASGWTLISFAPEETLWAAMRERAFGTLGLLAIVAAGVWLAYAWQMRRFDRALLRLADALKMFATRRPSYLDTTGELPEEFQPLGQAIRQLSTQLANTHDDLEHSLAEQQALSLSLQRTLEQREQEIEARTVELRQANAELDRLNRTDPLTGCLNRRGLQHMLSQWNDANGRLRGAVTVIAIDVDHFKAYNDRYGHAAGDVALQRIAGVAASGLRDGEDLLARMGGEEFLLLSRHGEEAATQVAERIRAEVQALRVAHEDSNWGVVTVSIGLAYAMPVTDHAQAFLRADEMLYRAKRGGRNRVEHG